MSTKQSDFEWYDDTLSINDDGHVEGQAWYGSFAGGYDVSVSVTSYEYQRRGQTMTNHVPHVVVTDATGSIVAEPHARDSHDPRTAIKRAKEAARYVVENPEQFVDN